MSAGDLVLRVDSQLHVLRSTGERLPGIVGVALPADLDEASFTVDPMFQPRQTPPGVRQAAGLYDEGIAPTATPITVAEAVEGCADDDAMRALYSLACQAVLAASPYYLHQQRPDLVRAHLDLVGETLVALEDRLNG